MVKPKRVFASTIQNVRDIATFINARGVHCFATASASLSNEGLGGAVSQYDSERGIIQTRTHKYDSNLPFFAFAADVLPDLEARPFTALTARFETKGEGNLVVRGIKADLQISF